MSKQKKLRNRLNDLFADLSEEAVPTPQEETTAPVWRWECDPAGAYLDCSPDVGHILGVAPEDFVGQPLASYLLVERSAQQFSTLLSEGHFPAEITLHYQGPANNVVTVRSYVFSIGEDNGEAGPQ